MSTAATVECFFGAAYFGVGRGIGGLIGGFAIDELGVAVTFQVFLNKIKNVFFTFSWFSNFHKQHKFTNNNR